jgi:two-component system response regulator HydG
MDGLTLLDHLQATSFAPAVLILTGVSDLSTAVSAMQRGAIDYLTKPFDGNTLRAKLRIALTRMRGRFPSVPTILDPSTVAVDLVIGSSVAMHHVWETLLRVADTHATVLLLGESGVGKSQFAQALHQQSPRRTCPFVTVHCAYLTQALAASTLFGHERGAFTGAERQHDGAFVRAHTGTLFLDEVGSLPLDVQGTLLHVLQNGTFERLGGKHTLHVDVRVIAASNQNLAHLVAAGTFREDLFYRLNVVTVHLPPLRARRGDIPLLVATFLARYNAAYGRTVHSVTEEAMQMLRHYAWPGNVRQLENIIARLVALSRTPLLQVEEIHAALRESWPLAKPEA